MYLRWQFVNFLFILSKTKTLVTEFELPLDKATLFEFIFLILHLEALFNKYTTCVEN